MSYEIRKYAQDNYSMGKLNSRIYGLPYTFTGITDPRGRLYNKTIMDQISIVHIQPGQYDTDMYLNRLGQRILNSIPFVGTEFDERVVKWGSNWLDYKNRFNALTSLVFNRMMSYDYGKNYKYMHSHDFLSNDSFGLNNHGNTKLQSLESRLEKFKNSKNYNNSIVHYNEQLKEAKRLLNAKQKDYADKVGAQISVKMEILKSSKGFQTKSAAEQSAAEGKLYADEITSSTTTSSELSAEMEQAAKKVSDGETAIFNETKRFMEDAGKSTNKAKLAQAYSDMTKQRRDKAILSGTDGMTYFLSPSSVSESISNNYSSGSYEGEANSHAQTSRDQADKIQRQGIIRSGIEAFGRQMQDIWTSFSGKFGVDSSVLNQGENVTYPKLWQNTDHSVNRNLILSFMSPYGDPYSVFDNIYVPMLSLMAFALPKQGGTINSYKAPFIIKAETPGRFISEMGVIENINWTKGGNNSEWSKNMLPLSLEVSLTIQDLYPTLTAGASAGEMNRNGAINAYITNMAGLMSYAGDEISGLERINRIKSELQFYGSKEGRDEVMLNMGAFVSQILTGNS